MSKKFLIGKKIGMTRLFAENGQDYPVTVVEAGPCQVVQIKNTETDNYTAVQIGFGNQKEKRMTKAAVGHLKKYNAGFKSHLKEFHVDDTSIYNSGDILDVDVFDAGDFVDVTGVSKGLGFTGVMKRHNYSGGRKTHGKNSVMRMPGSVGASASPSRIWPGKRMAGRAGNDQVTVRNLEVVRVDKDNHLLFIKGAIPGAKNGIVHIDA